MSFFLRPRTQTQPNALWFRDYQPGTLAEIVGNRDLVESLQIYVETNNLPNLLISGPNGTAKRTMAELTARTYLGDLYKKGCITIDGSINRGKDTVTNSNEYKKTSTGLDSNKNIMSFVKSYANLKGKKKIIIIYNFDHMTIEAQNAMRRIIELYAPTVRFFLVCNNMENIIEPVQSRCTPLRTGPITDPEIIGTLKHILAMARTNQPSLPDPDSLDEEVYQTICLLSSGDLKKAINNLQVMAHAEPPTVATFYAIFNIPPVQTIRKIIRAVQSPDTYQEAYDTLDQLLKNGYNASDILNIFNDTVARTDWLPLTTRVAYQHAIANSHIHTEITSSNSHLFGLIARLGKYSRDGYTNLEL